MDASAYLKAEGHTQRLLTRLDLWITLIPSVQLNACIDFNLLYQSLCETWSGCRQTGSVGYENHRM